MITAGLDISPKLRELVLWVLVEGADAGVDGGVDRASVTGRCHGGLGALRCRRFRSH